MAFFQQSYITRATACMTACWCLCAAPQAAEPARIRTAAQTGTAPKYVVRMQDGQPTITGLCIDIQRALEKLEPGLRFVGDQAWQPTTRLEAEIAAGSLDAACGLSRTPEREAKFVYLEPALFSVRYFLVARVDDAVQITGLDDVRALGAAGVILVPHGFGPVARLREAGGLLIDSGAPDSHTNLMKLMAGRGRFYYHRAPGILAEIRKAGLEGKVKILPAVMDRQEFYMVLGKAVAPDLADKMRAAIVQLERSGELQRLVNRWYEE